MPTCNDPMTIDDWKQFEDDLMNDDSGITIKNCGNGRIYWSIKFGKHHPRPPKPLPWHRRLWRWVKRLWRRGR